MSQRRGFTLIEVMISVTVLLVIMGAAVQFFRRQTNAVTAESQRMDAMQNAEFATSQIERELREAGAGVADVQPMIVQLDTNAITFNANMLSADDGDLFAVYRASDSDPAATRAMLKSERMPLPNSNPPQLYPNENYLASEGVQSGAETISYYLTRDSAATTSRTYALWRRVNATKPTLIARNIVKLPSDTIPLFTYYQQDTLGRLVAIQPRLFPLYHSTIHGAASDTARSALTDSVRVVRVHLVALSLDRSAGADSIKYRVAESRVRLMNAGLLQLAACGQIPLGASTPIVTQSIAPRGVTITWSRSNDDGTGEKDIERYAIFRRAFSAEDNGDPIASIPAKGANSYSFVDNSAQPGATYVYGVAAQDCTPRISAVATSAAILISP